MKDHFSNQKLCSPLDPLSLFDVGLLCIFVATNFLSSFQSTDVTKCPAGQKVCTASNMCGMFQSKTICISTWFSKYLI